MATDLAVRQNGADPDALKLGQVMFESGYFKDIRKAAEAAVKILAGREMGFGPAASVMGVHVIEGKPAISAGLMASAVQRSGRYRYRLEKGHPTTTECTVHFFEGRELIGTSTFTMGDAQAAGLAGRTTWKQYPKNMLFSRALSNGVRWYCPDVFQGAVYTPEEMGADVNAEGELIAPPRAVTSGEVMQAAAIGRGQADPDTADYGDPTVLTPAEPPTIDQVLAQGAQVAVPSERQKRRDQPEADPMAESARIGTEELRRLAGIWLGRDHGQDPLTDADKHEVARVLRAVGVADADWEAFSAAAFERPLGKLAHGHLEALRVWQQGATSRQWAQAIAALYGGKVRGVAGR